MKIVPVESEGLTLKDLLPEIASEEAVFLTVGGEVRFVVLPADEADQEVVAMRANDRLMAFLERCGERARTSPRKSLKQVRAEELPRKRSQKSASATGRVRRGAGKKK